MPQGYLQSTDKKVVYLVEELHDNPRDKANAIADEGAQPKRGLALTNPIPENQAGDGVYFRPENGAPVPEGQVSSIICTYRVSSFIFLCKRQTEMNDELTMTILYKKFNFVVQ